MVNATPINVVDKLRILVEDQQLRIDLGRRGRAYVEEWHDLDRVVGRLIQVYQGL